MDLKIANTIRPVDWIIFDCDGVLLNTMPAKIEAFRKWVPEEYAELREPFLRYIMGSFGKSRTLHIRHFYRDLVGVETDDAFLRREVARFTEICEPLCAGADWCAGALPFVEACRDNGVPRYVLSGTPEAELRSMLESAGAAELFTALHGSPPGKPEWMDRILAETGARPERTVFIGDANADQEAALHAGVWFVYFPSEAERPKAPIDTEVSDLRQLLPDGKA